MEFELKPEGGIDNSVYLHDEAHSAKNEDIKIVYLRQKVNYTISEADTLKVEDSSKCSPNESVKCYTFMEDHEQADSNNQHHDNDKTDADTLTVEDSSFYKPLESASCSTSVKSYTFTKDHDRTSSHHQESNDQEIIRSRKPMRCLDTESQLDRDEDFVVKRKHTQIVSYETLVWIIFVICNIAILVDRFSGNGDIVLSRKKKLVHRLNNEKWGLTITNYIWAFTGRTLIVAQNLMFYTTLSCIPNILVDIAPRWIRIDGIRDTHIKIHRLCGIFLIGIPVVAHVLLIFVPPMVDKTKFHYHPPSEYNYSKLPFGLNWTRIYDPAAVDGFQMSRSDGVHITSDEVYRTVLMIVLFCVLFPISRSKWLNDRSYSLAMAIHGFAGFWYGIDNVRKLSHGLAWVFNIPLMIVWLIDRLFSTKYYRKSHGQIVKKRIIGNNEYIDIRVKLNKNFKKTVGDVYYLLEDNEKLFTLERSHPFTSFSNHTEDASWDIGFIITVVEDHQQSSPAWTRRLRNTNESKRNTNLQCWGPYRSSSNELYKELLLNETPSFVLFGSGSGFGYISDVLSILAYRIRENKNNLITSVQIHYSARTAGLLYNFANEIQEKLEIIQEKKTASVVFRWYLTSDEQHEFDVTQFENSSIEIIKGRVNYEKIIQRCSQSSNIYFTGRPSLSDMVQKFADKYNKRFIKDFVNTQRGTSDKMLIVKYLKYTFWSVLATVILCLVVGTYLKV